MTLFGLGYRDRTFAMVFLGGFVGVAQDMVALALRPEIGWVVRGAESTTQWQPPGWDD